MPATIFCMPSVFRAVIRTAMVVIAVALVVYFVRAFDSRRLPDLGIEYRIHFDSEFVASRESETRWQDLLDIEEKLARELEQKIGADRQPEGLLDRYSKNSLTSPSQFGRDWNRSYEITAPAARGVAVMLHGLTDSPYSMLSTAQAAVDAGYNVIVPRMPGHGFAVGGLLQARWEDWTATTRIAIRHAMEIREPGQQLLVVGYSNGGLLAINYALRCQNDDKLPCPDRIVLLSPAISISPAAVVSDLHSVVSWAPYFEKFQWLSVLPEIDPFKFTSFPKRAAWEIHQLSRQTNKLLSEPDRTSLLPPILTFQSLVDSTVSSNAVVSRLYDRLPANGSHLVIYDVNRNSTMIQLMRRVPDDPVDTFEMSVPHDYDVTVLRNFSPQDLRIEAMTLPAGRNTFERKTTSLEWPLGIFSLSHIAVPFPSTDPLYGDGESAGANDAGVVLGAITPRGELGVLALPSDYFLRSRYNPFFSFQVRYMNEWLLAYNL